MRSSVASATESATFCGYQTCTDTVADRLPSVTDTSAWLEPVVCAALSSTSHPEADSPSTEGALADEHTTNDSYWGDGGNGSGQNKLGHLLMQVRDELRVAGNDLDLAYWKL